MRIPLLIGNAFQAPWFRMRAQIDAGHVVRTPLPKNTAVCRDIHMEIASDLLLPSSCPGIFVTNGWCPSPAILTPASLFAPLRTGPIDRRGTVFFT